MKLEFLIHGPIRGGKNHVNITRTGQRYPNLAWGRWRDEVVREILAQVGQRAPFQKPLSAVIAYWKGDLRRRDVPAAMDALWHCFERSGIIADDALIVNVAWLDMGLDRKNPRVEISLKEI